MCVLFAMITQMHPLYASSDDTDDEGDWEEDDEEGGIRIGDIYLPPPPLPACTFDSTGPRLIITHIENYFFKSYAGKQVSNRTYHILLEKELL